MFNVVNSAVKSVAEHRKQQHTIIPRKRTRIRTRTRTSTALVDQKIDDPTNNTDSTRSLNRSISSLGDSTSSGTYVPHRKSCLKDTTQAPTPSQEFALKKVIFDDIEVREYPQILGDNPAVSEGVPLTITWKYQARYSTDIDLYECMRKPMRRKGRRQLLISSKKRVQILVAAGYSFEKIGEAIVDVDSVRSQRLESAADSGYNGPIDVLSETLQTSGAAIMKVGRRGSKILRGGVTAAMGGLKIKQPKQKSVTNPAC